MADNLDSLFLKSAVAKGLIDQDLARAVFKEAQERGVPASELLVQRGVMTPYNVDLLNKEVSRSQGPKVIAGFEIRSKLGQGGMGAVYRATQLSIGREVALKVMSPDVAKNKGFAERFLREAMAMGAINHPNVITCFDAGQDGKILYMALELMTGGDADQLSKSFGGIVPPMRACEIVRDCAAGLAAIARAGLIHRDIKPANIFLGEDGTAKLADLGLARHEDGNDQMTRTGTAMGTPAFMSPEQAEGDDGLDIRSDIYALGATLFALATGQPPFAGPSAYAIVAKVINDPVPDPRSLNPNIPDPVVQIIRTAMHKDRRKRHQTPGELQAALVQAIDGMARAGVTPTTLGAMPVNLLSQAHPTPHTHVGAGHSHRHAHRTPAPTTTSTRRTWLMGGGIFAAVAVATVVTVAMASGKPSAPPVDAAGPTTATRPESAATSVVPAPAAKPAAAPKPVDLTLNLAPNDPWLGREEWTKHVLALSPDRQLVEVVKALKQLNPGFSGVVAPRLDIAAGTVSAIELDAPGLLDLRPLAALSGLRALAIIGGTQVRPAGLYDLAPLKDLPLTAFRAPFTMVDDLAPLAGKELVEVDLGGTPARDLRPILGAGLKRLAFTPQRVEAATTDALRTLATLEMLGPAWDSLFTPVQFWPMYDLGGFPGSRAPAIATAAPPPVGEPQVNPGEPEAPVQSEKPEPPKVVTIRPLVLPDGLSSKAKEPARVFNDGANRLLAAFAQKRREAGKTVSDTLGRDYKRELSASAKDGARLQVANVLNTARKALDDGAPTRDPAFTDERLPRTSSQALADWRAVVEPLEAEAAGRAEELRQKALKDLEPLADDPKSGAPNLIEQLTAMVPAPPVAGDADPLPVEGCIWRIDCMTALPHDTVLRDLTGIHPSARVTGEIVETDYGKALRADGKSSQISVALRRPLGDRTLMAWVNNAYHQQSGGGLIGLQSPDGARYESIAFFDGERGWGIENDGRRQTAADELGYGDGYWHHVALIVEGTHRTLLVDGKPVAEDQNGGTQFPVGSELYVGKRCNGRDANRYLAALIDGPTVFDRALGRKDLQKVINAQSARAERNRTAVRAREWVPVPLANGDFSRIANGRPADWIGRGDGISVAGEGAERFLRLELLKVGQEGRALKQPIRLDPLWRSLRLGVRVRLTRQLEEPAPAPPIPANAGVEIVLEDPTGAQPVVRRILRWANEPPPGEWLELSDAMGWPVPAGYTQLTVVCALRSYLGSIDIDDVRLWALAGRP